MSALSSFSIAVEENDNSFVDSLVALEKLDATIERIAPFPVLAEKILELLASDKSDIRSLSQLVLQEPLIASKLIKYANSPLYISNHPCRTIDQCIMCLGTKTVSDICIALCLKESLGTSLIHYPLEDSGYWKHSISVATVARSAVSSLNLSDINPSEIYLAGLLHDIGKLVLDEILSSDINAVSTQGCRQEQALMGITHAEVGAKIAAKWNLPRYLTAVIGNHHGAATNNKYQSYIAVVKLADYIAILMLNEKNQIEHELEQELDIIAGLLQIQRERIDAFIEYSLLRANEIEEACTQLA